MSTDAAASALSHALRVGSPADLRRAAADLTAAADADLGLTTLDRIRLRHRAREAVRLAYRREHPTPAA